jgi:hypothetical protein
MAVIGKSLYSACGRWRYLPGQVVPLPPKQEAPVFLAGAARRGLQAEELATLV